MEDIHGFGGIILGYENVIMVEGCDHVATDASFSKCGRECGRQTHRIKRRVDRERDPSCHKTVLKAQCISAFALNDCSEAFFFAESTKHIGTLKRASVRHCAEHKVAFIEDWAHAAEQS